MKTAAQTNWRVVYEQTRKSGKRIVEADYISWVTLQQLEKNGSIRIIEKEER